MNRQRYRLVFSQNAGGLVPAAESTRGRGKAASGARSATAMLGALLMAAPALAQVPVPQGSNAGYSVVGNKAFVNQVGNKAIHNWQSFNVGAGNTVQFGQVNNLTNQQLVPGASFTSLNRIWDINPSVIAGSITQAVGQKANVILVNSNGIAFMGGSQVNLASFTASTLNIADKYILNGLLSDINSAQYEKALDGTEARGFIQVFEGARISADSQGRVMLIAPTVVNAGAIDAPDGQVVLAAGTRAFLRSDDSADLNVRGLLVEVDSSADATQVGHATNAGSITSARGNVTMVGYAVNQNGIARATSSVVANGSVYLMAKDTAPQPPSTTTVRNSKRGGQVTLGAGSLTEVLPDVGDATTTVDGATGTGVVQASQVRVLGQQVYVASGATIKAPSGDVRLTAVDDPSLLNETTGTVPANLESSGTARLHVASGAVFDVAGLSNVQIAAGRNTVAVELRGDELKDSPVNRNGPLRGEKDLYVDIGQALANSDAGKDTLIARDSLLAYQARLERGIAERSSAGGTVLLDSQGQTVVEKGVTVDLSGGSLAYQQGTVKTTVLSAKGQLVDMADAAAGTRYDSIVSRYVIDYGRWNQKEVIELPSALRFAQSFTEGRDAGSLNINSKGPTFMQADVVGKTVVGERQAALGIHPRGAQFTLDARALQGASAPARNQSVVIDRFAIDLPSGFGANAELPDDLKLTLGINANLLGKDHAAELALFTDQATEVRSALRAPLGGAVDIQARDLTVKADISAPSGSINLTSGINATGSSLLRVEDGVRLDTSGAWVNLLQGVAGSKSGAMVDGGSIALNALASADKDTGAYLAQGTVSLGAGVSLDASGGALLTENGKLKEGTGGSVTVSGYSVEGLAGAQLSAYGLSEGGTLNLTTREIGIGGLAQVAPAVGYLQLDPLFFTQGGFARYKVTALERLDVADNTTVQPRVTNRELRADFRQQPTGAAMAAITAPVVRDDLQRESASIALVASKKETDTGTLRIGKGARVEVDPGAVIALEARNTLDIEGSLVARGGTISASLVRGDEGSFQDQTKSAFNLWVGESALLDASGIAQTVVDTQGLTQGKVLSGGTVNLSSKESLVALAGARIDVSGAEPVRIDERNEAGGVGRAIASDAGSVNLTYGNAMLLDATLDAAAGSPSQRGGNLVVSRSPAPDLTSPPPGFDPRVFNIVLQSTVAPQTAGLAPTDVVDSAGGLTARIGTEALEKAGFDRMRISSPDGIVLADGLNLGAGRSLPLREVQLDAVRIDTQGNASVTADAVRLGSYSIKQPVGSEGSTVNNGVFTANARLLELAGNLRLQGMARSELTGTELVQLSAQNSATIETTGDLTLRGGVIAPGSLAQITLKAAGRDVRLESVGSTPVAPLSALGKVRIEAQNITQAGRLVAPFGQIELVAQGDLVLAPGSVTSVSAQPGQVLPLGQLQNGVDWLANSDTPLQTLPDKSIRLTGGAVQLQAGSKVNVSGGGDLQAFEFTVGPGGSADFLADANTFAILPGFQGGFAPSDASVGAAASVRPGANLADPLQSTGRAIGEAVYLSGVSGLPDGTYTLLPAHYALLPGALAVRLDSSAPLLRGQAYTREDGVRIAAGYVTDSRANAPRAGDWRAVEVLTQEQLRDRSEYTLSKASQFFAGKGTLPQDAGLLSMSTQSQIQLEGTLLGQAASGGRGMAVDISAPNLVVVGGSPAGIDPSATQVDVAKINALGADSVLLGATRTRSGNETTLAVGSSQLTLANDALSPLAAPEVMLAATDTLTLKAGSKIDAQGADGNAGVYKTVGDGAFVRAASTSALPLVRSGSSGATGTLVGEVGSVVQASKAIAMDATLDNSFAGQYLFVKNGKAVAGEFSLGASRINLGDPVGTVAGITFKQADLNALLGLNSLALTSYAGFDIYGSVDVGGLDGNGRPTLQNLTLQGPGLAGVVDGSSSTGATVNLRASNLTLTNSGANTFSSAGTLGTAQLNVVADKLMFGTGEQKPASGSAPSKTIAGFSTVNIEAGEIIAAGVGSTQVNGAVTTLTTARLSGLNGAQQTLDADTGLLTLNQLTPAKPLAKSSSLGAGWTLNAEAIRFDAQADLASGQLSLNARTGDVTLGANADLSVAGRAVDFFNLTRGTWGGSVTLNSANGSVNAESGSRIDVSGGAGADGGTLTASAVKSTVNLGDAQLLGTAIADASGKQGEGARVRIDAQTLNNFSALNAALNAGGPANTPNFQGERTARARTGNLSVAAGDTVRAKQVSLSADAGTVSVSGTLSASGAEGGKVGLYGESVVLATGGRIEARASSAGGDGGRVEIAASTGTINLESGSTIDVTAGVGGEGGTLHLRALRTAGNEVAVTAVGSSILGARDVSLEAVRVYDNITTLTATGASTGNTLSLATINANDNAYAANHGVIKARLGKTGDDSFHILSGTEVRSTGNMALGTGAAATDWNLKDSAAGGEAGVLTLRAGGSLAINSNLSDGFLNATPSVGQTPSALLASSVRGGRSWSFNLVAGADTSSANVMATRNTGDLTVAAGKVVRTGTGNIRMAAGQDIKLASDSSAVYTAGGLSGPLAGFVAPITQQAAFFAQGGGDVELTAGRNVDAVASTQLYSDWLYRQGRLSDDGVTYLSGANNSLAWFVRFDQFRQGVGALGGGDVTVRAGGSVSNLSASAPTQGRMASSTADASKLVKTGGGNVTVEAAADVLAGQYFADNGNVRIVAEGRVNSTLAAPARFTTLAVGDGQVSVKANGDVSIATILNPQLLDQTIGAPTGAVGNAQAPNNAQTSIRRSYFSTYTADTGAELSSLSGNTALLGANAGGTNTLLPPSLSMTSYSGDVAVESTLVMAPAAKGQLELLAQGNVNVNVASAGKLTLSDSDPTLIASPLRPVYDPILTSSPVLKTSASTPVHLGDATSAKVYAVQGDVRGAAGQVSLELAKAVEVRAGGDVLDFNLEIQHANEKDRSVVEAGRDITFVASPSRYDTGGIRVGGVGALEVSAQRNVNLGTSGGLLSRGNLDNNNLGAGGADIRVLAGAGPAGLDAPSTLQRLAARVASGGANDTDLWLARWLSGNNGLSAAEAPAAVAAVAALDPTAQRDKVREMLFTALRQTGRDANAGASGYGGDFARGYAALELAFPGIGEKDAQGNFTRYDGNLNLFASRIKTERGGSIDIMVPGGGIVVGLANTPSNLVNVGSNVLGVVASATGDVRAFTRDDMLVNQSRILTVGGGNVLLWSSEGDIDAGKGKKTAGATPPPIISVDAQGNVTQELQGAASGSGIGALQTGTTPAGDVDLIAPKGTVNAGDAGIRAGNLNIAALVVLGADNISVSGTSAGTPVADTSAVSAASSGASSGGDDTGKVVAALNQAAADSAKAAQELAASLRPSVVRVDVLGFGDGP